MREQERAREELARLRATEFAAREQELMGGREFEGHNPPVIEPDTIELDDIEQLVSDDPEARQHISQLWPKAYAALEAVLDDPDATSTSKVSASRIVQQAVAAERDARRAAMPQKIVFETAAFSP